MAKNTRGWAGRIGGFSLASVIVSAGIAGGLALGVAHITRETSSSVKRTEISLAEADLMKRIRTLLYSSSACKNTLGKNPVVTGPIGALYTDTDSTSMSVQDTFKDIIKISGLDLIVDDSALSENADGNKEGQISLSVKITRMSKAFRGVREINHNVDLSVVVDGSNQIVSCHHALDDTETTGLVTESMEEACEDLGGTYNAQEDTPCSASVGNEQRLCTLLGRNYDPSGTPRCSP